MQQTLKMYWALCALVVVTASAVIFANPDDGDELSSEEADGLSAKVASEDVSQVSQPIPDVCFEKPEMGPCEAYIPSFYYDPVQKSCESFVFGGCRGNGNRFSSKELCEAFCSTSATSANF